MPDLASVRIRPDIKVVWITPITFFICEDDRCHSLSGIAHSLTDYSYYTTQSGVTAAELSCCHSTLNNKQACSLVGQLVKSQKFFFACWWRPSVGGGPWAMAPVAHA